MEQGPTFLVLDGASALLGSVFGLGIIRVMGSGVDYRGIVWRKPKGHVSKGPMKDALLHDRRFNYYYNYQGFAAVVRPFLYFLEGAFLLLFAAGALTLISWAFATLINAL